MADKPATAPTVVIPTPEALFDLHADLPYIMGVTAGGKGVLWDVRRLDWGPV